MLTGSGVCSNTPQGVHCSSWRLEVGTPVIGQVSNDSTNVEDGS